jgi:hypothetical protein
MKLLLSTIVLTTGMQFGCSSDQAGFTPWQLEDLQPADGFSLRVPEFEVPSGQQVQNCYFVQVPDLGSGQTVWINRVLTAINPGSHHLNVFQVRTITGLDPAKGTPVTLGKYQGTVIEGGNDYMTNPCWSSANWADWPLIANSQQATIDKPETDWKLPDGVAIRLTPGEMLMMQTHYVNTTDQPTKYGARIGINFYRYQQSTAPMEMGALIAQQKNIRICDNQPSATFSGTCQFPSPVTIIAANGHFHSRGQRFSMFSWDGMSASHPAGPSKFYESQNWNEPPMVTDLNLNASVNTGFWWDCQFQWQPPTVFTCSDIEAKDPMHQTNCCYTFGGNTDLSEHCNAFVYYYPKTASAPVCTPIP